jgi:hypothetical protein
VHEKAPLSEDSSAYARREPLAVGGPCADGSAACKMESRTTAVSDDARTWQQRQGSGGCSSRTTLPCSTTPENPLACCPTRTMPRPDGSGSTPAAGPRPSVNGPPPNSLPCRSCTATTSPRTDPSSLTSRPIGYRDRTNSLTVSGSTGVGSTLTAKYRVRARNYIESYEWKRDGKAIRGATGSTSKLTAADTGHHRHRHRLPQDRAGQHPRRPDRPLPPRLPRHRPRCSAL